jgi:hypothetical protein
VALTQALTRSAGRSGPQDPDRVAEATPVGGGRRIDLGRGGGSPECGGAVDSERVG